MMMSRYIYKNTQVMGSAENYIQLHQVSTDLQLNKQSEIRFSVLCSCSKMSVRMRASVLVCVHVCVYEMCVVH